MESLQDRVNKRVVLTDEEAEEAKAANVTELALKRQMVDFQSALNVNYSEVIKARQDWWKKIIAKHALDTATFVYGIDWSVDESSGTIVVLDMLPPKQGKASPPPPPIKVVSK
jgi:hypothetical protein